MLVSTLCLITWSPVYLPRPSFTFLLLLELSSAHSAPFNSPPPGYDTVISALGRAAIHTQVPLLALADDPSSPITTFFPSEYGTDIAFSPSSATEKPHQQKLAVRAFIRDHVTKLNVTYLVTGPYPELFFAPSRNGTRGGSWDAKSCEATILGEGAERVSFCSMRDVGRCVVGALKTPFVSSLSPSPRILKVNSFTTTSNDALAEFKVQTGRKWDVKYTSLDALRRLEDSAWREGWPNATPLTLRRIWTEGGTLYEKRDNGMIGMEEGCETLADVVRRAVEKAGV